MTDSPHLFEPSSAVKRAFEVCATASLPMLVLTPQGEWLDDPASEWIHSADDRYRVIHGPPAYAVPRPTPYRVTVTYPCPGCVAGSDLLEGQHRDCTCHPEARRRWWKGTDFSDLLEYGVVLEVPRRTRQDYENLATREHLGWAGYRDRILAARDRIHPWRPSEEGEHNLLRAAYDRCGITARDLEHVSRLTSAILALNPEGMGVAALAEAIQYRHPIRWIVGQVARYGAYHEPSWGRED